MPSSTIRGLDPDQRAAVRAAFQAAQSLFGRLTGEAERDAAAELIEALAALARATGSVRFGRDAGLRP